MSHYQGGPARSTGGQAGQQAPDNRQFSSDSFGALEPSELFDMPQEDFEFYLQDFVERDEPLDEQPSTSSAPADWQDEKRRHFAMHQELLLNDAHASYQQQQPGWHPSSTYGDEYGDGTATSSQMPPNDLSEMMPINGYHPANANANDSVQLDAKQQLTVKRELADDQNMEFIDVDSTENYQPQGYDDYNGQEISPHASASPRQCPPTPPQSERRTMLAPGKLSARRSSARLNERRNGVNDANMAGPSSSSGGGAGYVPKIKPRKYQLKPDTEKMNPTYKLKRDRNNDAVRKSRLKAKEEQEKRDAELKNLRDKVHSQETEIETLKRENRDLRLQLRLFLQKN